MNAGRLTISMSKLTDAAHQMADKVMARIPALLVGIVVFIFFYILSIFISRTILRSTRRHRANLGVVFSRLMGSATILVGFLVAFSVVAPSFQAADLIKVLGIGGVAIGFAFQNILQNFLAGLLLLWAEPFRIGDEIKLDSFEGTVEDIQTRATIIKTYDGRRVVIPNADLFTHSVIVNTAIEMRRWDYPLTVKGAEDLPKLKSTIVATVSRVPGVLPEPGPEAFVMDLGDSDSNVAKVRVLWSTKASRHHEMLISYDRVLASIQEALSRFLGDEKRSARRTVGAERAA
jgi:small conductance mechanosensitive channel